MATPLTPEQLLALNIRRTLAVEKRIRRRREARVPGQKFPRGAQLRYAAGLKRMQGATETAIRSIIYPELNQITLAPAEFITRKVDEVRVAIAQDVNIGEIENLTASVGKQLNLVNRAEVGKQLSSVLGVDPIMAEPWIGDHLFTFQRENVNLIKSLNGTELDDIENLLLRANRQGLQVGEIRKQIQKRFKVSRSKADLLARDQVGKLNGEITKIRQEGIGVTHYIWRTARDERVREDHLALDGTRQKWGDPPVVDTRTGRRAEPGGDYNCRCRAEPDLSPLTGEKAPEGKPTYTRKQITSIVEKQKERAREKAARKRRRKAA